MDRNGALERGARNPAARQPDTRPGAITAVGKRPAARPVPKANPPVAPPLRSAREETRFQLLERLTNPLLSLYEASVILRVCPATVRRYSDASLLPHERTAGGQRRFRLHDVLALLAQREARHR